MRLGLLYGVSATLSSLFGILNACFRSNPTEVFAIAKPTTTTTTTTCKPVYICPAGWTLYVNSLNNANCFIAVTGDPTYGFPMGCDQAAAACASLDGHLASIHDVGENTVVYNLGSPGGTVTSFPLSTNPLQDLTCIGLTPTVNPTDPGEPSMNQANWEWTDGSVYNYRNWALNNMSPNNDNGDERCVIMYTRPFPFRLDMWDDLLCSSQVRNAICEQPATLSCA